MTTKHIHIIVFDIPYPATYGGAIDVFYRIKSLAQLGIAITLHCFYKDELHHYEQLESLCRKVYYYPRQTTWKQMLHMRPYAVVSRRDQSLLKHLLQDNDPILFEGLVSCDLLSHPLLANRKKYLRECNIEHDYYYALSKAARSCNSKLYFLVDAIRLRFFERNVRHASAVFAIAHQDEQHFRSHYPNLPVIYLPAAHPDSEVVVPSGIGSYILYHGNLDVAENYDAARIIASDIATQLPDTQFIIAGRYHNHVLDDIIGKQANVQWIPNPDSNQMKQLIVDAQIHLLITRQATGLKLKLLNVLYNGRHVVVNSAMVTGTELASVCHIADDKRELADLCRQLSATPVTAQQIAQRKQLLAQYYDNKKLGLTLLNNL